MQTRKPEWIRITAKNSENPSDIEEILKKLSLHTVCEEANCPNRMECFGKRITTFMILGRLCTRNCAFCNVEKHVPQSVDPNEPEHVAQAVVELKLRHVVITSVTRDDLSDGGAGHFAEVIRKIKELDDKVVVEVLIPDFQGDEAALYKVVNAHPEIINHNVETVPRLYPTVRPMAIYQRSLELLQRVKHMDASIHTKSGIMLGLGEKKGEVLQVFEDLRKADCDLLTVGQYLAPSKKHHPVVEYIHPDVFEKYRVTGLEMGFKYVASAPLVRSSYMAEKFLER